MNVEPVSPEERLRIAVLGDLDGVHTRSWLRWFIARGHEIHAISFYPPSKPVDGVTLHVLRDRLARQSAGTTTASSSGGRARGLMRLVHGIRYRLAGLNHVLKEIQPEIFHAHYVVEHGFYGALAGFHPYVVTAWGSDILVEPKRDPVSRWIAKWTLARADLVTSNNRVMAEEIVRLGVARSKVEVVTLGADAWYGERLLESVNVAGRREGGPMVLSTRAHERLYNIDVIIAAFARAAGEHPGARLMIAHSGSMTGQLKAQATASGAAVEFTGTVDAGRLRDLMTGAEIFVSVPSSDGTSVALLQAMAAGAFPVVADLATQREWITDGENGLLVPARDVTGLAGAIGRALADPALRRAAAERNRDIVRARGTNETQMARLERLCLWLAGRP